MKSLKGFLFVSVLIAFTVFSLAEIDMTKLAGMKARAIGPAGMSGRVTAIDVVLSDTRTIYLGTASGGLWKSTDGGVTWDPIFDDQPATSIGALAIDQRNPDVIWAGTGEGNPRNSQTSGTGLYKSFDGGRHWTRIGFEKSSNIHRVLIHPQDSNTVYVGVQGSAWGEHDGRGVFKTTDGGKNWKHVLAGDEKTGIADLIIDPRNPDKLLASMWEFRRWPWFMKSGGPGSGIFVTFDGGETWSRRTSEDGLPKGELGRIGLAIAQSNPNIVYAMVEAKKNGLYRSNDGGFKWELVSDANNVNPRPFYYAEIYVDPGNENRIFSLHSRLTMSEDGGKTFNNISGSLHADHQALWIHPDDPSFMIDGNDGGAGISYNGGKTWRYIENLPLGQFYHIRVDNQTPYNVYGGLQDNGSWRGPAYLWRRGGLGNHEWVGVGGGDGFDVLPDPLDPRHGYSMSQGGNLSRYDLQTGSQVGIRPPAPNDTRLRFNWNAALAIDPFDKRTIYYGSQFVHNSSDHGRSWRIISPDLTTNDDDKQKQIDSGGLTYDVTGAENFTTITTIAPSPVERGVIWVGTDDGNVQMTQDGGKTWSLVSTNISDVAEGTWVPQIQASAFEAGEAFVVFEDHRRNNWTPYLYKTTDYGKTWTRLVSEGDVEGYVLSVVQDPVEPKLMFVGTELGLYFSVDAGASWTRWTSGFPTASTMDLAIHPTEHDLVIGTFGRSVYVLDDIRPLRELARRGTETLDAMVHVFEPPEAVQFSSGQAGGVRYGDDRFRGTNRPAGAMISYVVNRPEGRGPNLDEMDEDEREARIERMRARFGDRADEMIERRQARDANQIRVQILDENDNVVSTIQGPAEPGLNRVSWNLRQQAPQRPGQRGQRGGGFAARFARRGPLAVPGDYTVKISVGRESSTARLRVVPDPRTPVTPEAILARSNFVKRARDDMQIAFQATARLTSTRDRIREVTQKLSGLDDKEHARELQGQARKLQGEIRVLQEMFSGNRDVQGIRRDPNVITSGFFFLMRSSGWEAPSASEQIVLEQAEARLQKGLIKVNEFFEKSFPPFQKAVEKADLPLFESHKPLTLPVTTTPSGGKGR